MELTHGGDVIGYRLRYGKPPLDFSASLNPLGMPDGVRRAAVEAAATATAYPDPLCRELREALARKRTVAPDQIICGDGAAEIIYRLVLAAKPRTALIVAPTFAEYEKALTVVNCRVAYHMLRREDDFVLNESILPEIHPGLDTLFLCQPNNPTGRLVDAELLHRLLARCAETGTLLLLDECFCSFVADPGEVSLVSQLYRHSNLFILDSFTKLYAMAGIRLGYGLCSRAELLAKMYEVGQPWSVSSIAQAAGIAALAEDEYVRRARRLIADQKNKLVVGLARLGCEVLGDEANYVFFYTNDAELQQKLMDKGILIRNCANFRGLGPGYYRVAVRLPDENVLLLQAIRDSQGR